jgi:type IV pilus assembly protein PilB
MTYTRERLGELLVKAGAIEKAQLDEGLAYQKDHGGKLGKILVEQLIVSEEQLAETLAEQKGLEHVSLANYPIDRDVVAIVPERVARKRLFIPIGYEDDRIVVAMADPLDLQAVDEVEVRSGRKAIQVVATESQILYAIDKYMTPQDAFQDVLQATAAEATADPVQEGVIDERLVAGADVPIVRLVNQIVREAITDRASDIHMEPMAKDIAIRYRVDGVLHEVMRVPRSARAELTSRIKIMADMNITERRRPQDGRIRVSLDGRDIDMRVASLPTPHGESIVIRILNQDMTPLDLEEVGMGADHQAMMEALLGRPYGAILVAGPTGSGKSTTMYAALKRLNTTDRKIITIEEPVEYQMEGVTQVAVNNKIGLTFAAGLRMMLRADPDVVMIGEVRDPETAETAVRAALTGHLVLSSIHTNDAPSGLTRLVDMGVPPYVTSSALLAVVAQRLVRKLCPACKKKSSVPADALVRLGMDAKRASKIKIYGPVGCDKCFNTGYKGRLGVFELMVMDDDIRKLFLKEAPAEALRAQAIEHGMRTLSDDALDKVAAGITSLEEMARVVV